MQPQSTSAGGNSYEHSYQIEPELLRPTPRPVCARDGNFAGLALRFGAMCLTVIGLYFIGHALFTTLVLTRGQDVPAQVTQRYVRRRYTKQTSYSHNLAYRYQVNGQSFTATQEVEGSDYLRYRPGTSIMVRISPGRPAWMPTLLVPSFDLKRYLSEAWTLTGAVCLVVVLAWWQVAIVPGIERGLVALGVPVPGRISRKWRQADVRKVGGGTHCLFYEFNPASDAAAAATHKHSTPTTPLTHHVLVTWQEFEAAAVDDIVTVLYNPQNPRHSLLYRYARFTVDS